MVIGKRGDSVQAIQTGEKKPLTEKPLAERPIGESGEERHTESSLKSHSISKCFILAFIDNKFNEFRQMKLFCSPKLQVT